MSVFKFANNDTAKLAAAILSSDTSLTVESGKGALFPTLSGGDTFRATLNSADGTTMEIVSVTARSGDVFTITRAQEGTTAAGFAAGATVSNFVTKSVAEAFTQRTENIAGLFNVSATDKVLGRSSSGAGVLEEITLTSTGRSLIDDTSTSAMRTTLGLGTVATLDSDTDGTLAANSDSKVATQKAVKTYADKQPEVLMLAVSDETTAITTGTAKLTFRMPFACSMTALPRANLNTVSSSGDPAIDINKNGASIFSTTLTIDASEKTSTTAATPAVLSPSPTTFADDDEITIDIDTAGTGAKGLKVTMLVVRT